MVKQRKKTWAFKVDLVVGSFNRVRDNSFLAQEFYNNLFFLDPKIEKHFANTDFIHQRKAFMMGLQFILDFLDQTDDNARVQVMRLARTHSKKNLNIHPQEYYYWIEALIMTVKKHDPSWYDDMEYYWREVVFYPVSFMISQYFMVEPEV